MMVSVLYTFIHAADVTNRGEHQLLVQTDHETPTANSSRFSSAITFDSLIMKDKLSDHDKWFVL
jgi:hypothetical protein